MPGDSIRAVNAHGSCVSPLNISAASLQAVNISAVDPEQWQNFTWANSSELAPVALPCFDISQSLHVTATWVIWLSGCSKYMD